jgi:signal transduction histidine kinase
MNKEGFDLLAITLPQFIWNRTEPGPGKMGAAYERRPFNLLRSYALTSLVAMFTIGGLSGVIFGNYLAENLLRRDAEVSQAFLQSMAEVEGGAELFRDTEAGIKPLLREQVYGLPELVDHIATMPAVVRANLYSDTGQVIWSTQANLLGKRFTVNHELEDALDGKTVFELKDIKEEQKAEYAEFGSDISRLVENYLPIFDESDGSVAAVVEIYKAPKILFDEIESALLLVWFSVAGATLFLYASLFWIVYRANSVIQSQQQRLVESETMVAIGEMASAIAHSIRNPIAAIRSSAELASETSRDPLIHETTDDIINETDRVEQWIRELLIYSRPEGSTQFQVAHLDRILMQSLEGYMRLMKQNNICLQCELDSEIPEIKGDAGLLGQMFNSILANAIEAMPDGGSLHVGMHIPPEPEAIRISITDTGHGIPDERLDGLLESCLTTKRYGLGIGMLLANRIVKRHGGSVSLHSEVGEGTTVVFEIPLRNQT